MLTPGAVDGTRNVIYGTFPWPQRPFKIAGRTLAGKTVRGGGAFGANAGAAVWRSFWLHGWVPYSFWMLFIADIVVPSTVRQANLWQPRMIETHQ